MALRTLLGMRTDPSPRPSLGQAALEDWRSLVRRSRPLDLEATLAACGFRPISERAPDSGTSEPGSAPTVDDSAADRRLAELVAEAAHDTTAARIVLQRLLPGLLGIARRRGRQRAALTVRIYNDLLANAWIVIRCYPIHRRPHRVAANLLRDVEYRTITREARLRRYRFEPWQTRLDEETSGLGPYWRYATPEHPFAELVQTLVDAKAAGAHPETLRLAAAIASGRTLGELAAEDGRTERTERYRRARAVAELRSLLVHHDQPDTAPVNQHGGLPA